MNLDTLKQKLWFNIFIRVAIIFIVFVLILTLSNVTFLVNFFVLKEKNALITQLETVSVLNLEDTHEVRSTLSKISENHNFDVEIYNVNGSILYTTHGGQMMDFIGQNNNHFNMSHEDMIIETSEILNNGVTFQTVVREFDKTEMLICKKEIKKDIFAEVRVPKQLITNSAAIANEFIVIVASICFMLSIIWILIFAKKFSKPISEMNEITKDMAALNFSRKIENVRSDEIGELAVSINELSDSLSSALEDLKLKNKKLEDDIEAERRLDTMRKAFIANVSHELKTPIAIINGYAEGLKFDINPESKKEYCNTIIEEGNRMNKLVLSILELSKYESGQTPVNITRVNIGDLVQDKLDKIFRDNRANYKNSIPKDTFVLADTIQIEQVLIALLENAVAHTPENGMVEVVSSGEDVIRISVFNTGDKIEEEKMSQIWQSFYRGDTSHKRDNSRFGLGLSIVSAIIKMHNSRCGVYNTENGVCFWFELKKWEL